MIDIQIKAGRDPQALAQLIASTHGEEVRDPGVAQIATLVRRHQADMELLRPTPNEVETVNFHKLDAENDWSDV